MKKFLLSVLLITFVNILYSIDIEKIDKLNHDGNHNEVLSILKDAVNGTQPDPAIIWRTARAMFEIADSYDKSRKNDKIALFGETMKVLEPHLDINYGDKYDRAMIVFYYASSLGSRSKEIGIMDSLGSLPEMKRLADKAIEIYPSLASAYFLKAKIEEEVPSLFGGDKFKMGVLFSQALKYGSDDLTILYDSANALYNRNWDDKRKRSLAEKSGDSIDSHITRHDRVIAREIIENGIRHYKTLENPSKRDTAQYNNMLNLQRRF